MRTTRRAEHSLWHQMAQGEVAMSPLRTMFGQSMEWVSGNYQAGFVGVPGRRNSKGHV